MKNNKIRKEMVLFFILIAAVAIGNGLSDSVYSNYFKEVYNVTAPQRAFIEFPRELPGLLCALVIASLSFLGDLKLSLFAQILASVGLIGLGVFNPPFGIMLLFLFVNSLGMHLFLPLQDSIGMSLAEPDKIGQRVGQYASIKIGVGFLVGIMVFIGFRTGLFTFKSEIKLIFLIGAFAFFIASIIAIILMKTIKSDTSSITKNRVRLVFRKEYRYYYLLTILHGVQKQIAYVFGSWVIVDLLLKGADIMSLLIIASSFIGIFFMRKLGKWIDKFGIKKMMYLDALSFIVVYIIYGFVVWGVSSKILPQGSWPVMIIYALFVLDRLSMQMGIIKSVYLRSIAINSDEVTATLSTGTSLDHIVSILAAQVSGLIWITLGPQWVFFMAAFFSLGNLFVAWRIEPVDKLTIEN